MQREEVLNKINELEKYFLRQYSEGQVSFLPEYNGSVAINEIIHKEKKLTLTETDNIVKIFNSVNETNHYNGSGWIDYQMQLLNLIKQEGIHIEIDKLGFMKIEK